jgi:hypothetical protein
MAAVDNVQIHLNPSTDATKISTAMLQKKFSKNPRMLRLLERWDADSDGTIDQDELIEAMSHQFDTEKEVTNLKRLIGLIIVAVVITIVVLFGTALVAAEVAKDSRPNDMGVLLTSDGVVVETAAAVQSFSLMDNLDFNHQQLSTLLRVDFHEADGVQSGMVVSAYRRTATALSLFDAAGNVLVIQRTGVTYNDQSLATKDGHGRLLAEGDVGFTACSVKFTCISSLSVAECAAAKAKWADDIRLEHERAKGIAGSGYDHDHDHY